MTTIGKLLLVFTTGLGCIIGSFTIQGAIVGFTIGSGLLLAISLFVN